MKPTTRYEFQEFDDAKEIERSGNKFAGWTTKLREDDIGDCEARRVLLMLRHNFPAKKLRCWKTTSEEIC